MKKRKPSPIKVKPPFELQWIIDEVASHPSFMQKRMFGCQIVYLHGRMALALISNQEPWNGLLLCTSREHHDSLKNEFKNLTAHKVLGKWLYLSQKNSEFESTVQAILTRLTKNDLRMGIEPQARSKKSQSKRKKKKNA